MSHLHQSLNIRFILVAFPPTSAAYANLLLLWCGLISTHPSWLESCHRVDYRSKKNPGGFPARIIGRVVEVRFKKIRCKDSYEKSRPEGFARKGLRKGMLALVTMVHIPYSFENNLNPNLNRIFIILHYFRVLSLSFS